MTDRARKRSKALPVYGAAGAAFALTAAGLGAQMAGGHDPALGAAKAAAPKVVVRRHVVVRRIERTVVVTKLVASSGGAPSSQRVASRGSVAAPVVRPAAPVVVAAAPAPAPAPAAPVTRSS